MLLYPRFSIFYHHKAQQAEKECVSWHVVQNLLQQLQAFCATASHLIPLSKNNSPQIPQKTQKDQIHWVPQVFVCFPTQGGKRFTRIRPFQHYHHSTILAQNYLDVHPSWLIRHLKYQHGEILQAIPGFKLEFIHKNISTHTHMYIYTVSDEHLEYVQKIHF